MRLILVMVLLLPVCALPQQPAQKKGPPPEPKNLKVLTGRSGGEVIQMMRSIRVALGVDCEYCHVRGDFASDDNPKKEVARNMMTMAHDINAKWNDGKAHVSCYTCHRGTAQPLLSPPDAPPSAPAKQ